MKFSLIHFHMIEVELHISNITYCFDHHAYSENTPTWILLSVPWICSSSSPDRVSRSIQIIKMGENRSSEFIRKLAKRAGNINEKARLMT